MRPGCTYYLADAHFLRPFGGPGRSKIDEVDAGYKKNKDGNDRKNIYVTDVTVLAAVDVLLHPSLAVHVLVCEREHPSLDTELLLNVIVGAPHASVAFAVPNAALISPADGLQPSVNVVPVAVIPGGTRSLVHVTVREAVDVLPQASLAVNVLV